MRVTSSRHLAVQKLLSASISWLFGIFWIVRNQEGSVHLAGAHADNDCQPAGHVFGVDGRYERHQVRRLDLVADLDPERVADATQELEVRAVQLARTLAAPQEVAGAVVPVGQRPGCLRRNSFSEMLPLYKRAPCRPVATAVHLHLRYQLAVEFSRAVACQHIGEACERLPDLVIIQIILQQS